MTIDLCISENGTHQELRSHLASREDRPRSTVVLSYVMLRKSHTSLLVADSCSSTLFLSSMMASLSARQRESCSRRPRCRSWRNRRRLSSVSSAVAISSMRRSWTARLGGLGAELPLAVTGGGSDVSGGGGGGGEEVIARRGMAKT